MARASLDDRVGKGRALADKYLDAAGVERIVRHELGIDEVELRALLDMHLQLVLAALALRQHDFILLARFDKDLLRLYMFIDISRNPALIDAEPAPGTHGYPGECRKLCHISPSSLLIQC